MALACADAPHAARRANAVDAAHPALRHGSHDCGQLSQLSRLPPKAGGGPPKMSGRSHSTRTGRSTFMSPAPTSSRTQISPGISRRPAPRPPQRSPPTVTRAPTQISESAGLRAGPSLKATAILDLYCRVAPTSSSYSVQRERRRPKPKRSSARWKSPSSTRLRCDDGFRTLTAATRSTSDANTSVNPGSPPPSKQSNSVTAPQSWPPHRASPPRLPMNASSRSLAPATSRRSAASRKTAPNAPPRCARSRRSSSTSCARTKQSRRRCKTLSGDFDDTTRLVDWMLDERLDRALQSLRDGTIDPVALRERGPMFYVGW
jgi:hypothetical protein